MSAASNTSSNVIMAQPTTVSEPYKRLRLILTGVVAAVALVMFAVSLVTALQWRGYPFFGAMVNPNLMVDGSVPLGERPWTGLAAGLRRLDVVTAINGEPLMATPNDYAGARARFREILTSQEVGNSITVQFTRPASGPTLPTCLLVPDESAQRCSVTYTLETLPDNDFISFFIVPFVIGLITVIVGITVLYLRPHQPAARVTAIFCILFGIFIGGQYHVNNTHSMVLLWLLATSFIGACIGTLAMIFPVRITLLYRYPWLHYAPVAGHVVLALVAVLLYLRPPSPQSFAEAWQLGLFSAILMSVLLVINLLRRRTLATSASIRDQSNTVLIGIALTAIPIALWLVNTLIEALAQTTPIPFNTSAIMPFFILPPLAMAYAVLQYRSVDTDRIISQGITYSLMLVALVIGYFLLVFGASLALRDAFDLRADSPFLIALTIFLIAILFLPVRTYLQDRIDRIYFRKRTNYQQKVEEFANTLTSLSGFDEIVKAFHEQLDSTIAPSRVFLFLPGRQAGDFAAYGNPRPQTDVRFENDSGVVKLLREQADQDVIYLEPGRPWPGDLLGDRSRLNILKTTVIARLRGRRDLIGFVSLGAPHGEHDTYPYEELRFVQNLCNQMAIAVERAQVVDSLERRVREQEVLSQVSQAVNFTIQFNDLLELIYAQTDKLLRAPYFYIVLREQPTDKLYFAFFVEDDERNSKMENRRWLMGHDLFSEVVRNARPMRVDDYAAAMAQRHSPIIYETNTLKGWMGVPLIAGTNTLGLLAVGSVETEKTFTDDQLKVFGDIASLAATSLDKARLFAETNLRARQLAALNAISQKLASELNVENLLELITESAVQILDSEAGALLLSVDDGKELEFKVAVGGSGQELVGRRFPANKGLAGEVATKGEPVIVNDAANDPRWGGEVSKDGFITTAVLAVPLIAQNKVIGVLQTLNKKGGGIFVKEDSELLTTFAGQAAVALENARLFQMTDLQLGQRVAELQALERIDVELNRSLDLQKVADITMRWAIANSGASAGVLGLVLGEAPNQQLQVVSSYGYEADDAPEGAEGKLWPLDKGIVSRVMRTRQPDLATDVKIDPNYIPSLRGAKSQLTIPMLSGGEINALLVLEKDVEPRLSLVDMSFAQRLAEHASIAIANAQFYAELTRANESKSEFVSFVAHELKNPMTSMKGYADLMLSGAVGKMSDQQQNFMGIIRSNVERMITLVNDLNDVTKLQTHNLRMEFAEVDFRNVVTETLRPLHKQIEDKGQQLHINMANRMPHIMADQNRLIQVMTNLVSNAFKYTPQDGQIYIGAELMENHQDGKGRDLGPHLHISVRDTGFGMSEEDLSKLFTPYFRSDNPLTREQPGTGLGLTITRGIVVGHGGNIWVESELGKGTTFHFTVPVVAEAEAEERHDATEPTR